MEVLEYLVIYGVELGENYSIDEARLVRHGMVSQSLIELHLRTQETQRGFIHHLGERGVNDRSLMWQANMFLSNKLETVVEV